MKSDEIIDRKGTNSIDIGGHISVSVLFLITDPSFKLRQFRIQQLLNKL